MRLVSSSAKQQKAPAWLVPLGIFLLLWTTANTTVDILRYGINNGLYWWFCNLATLIVATGLLMKSRGTIIGITTIALYTQSLWVFDNLWQLFTKQSLFGLVQYLYQPGLPTYEFLLAHYHYFNIPIGILALCHLPRRGTPPPYKAIIIINSIIFGVSYFAFTKAQNVNCIHAPCFSGLGHLGGPLYSVIFFTVVMTLNMLLSKVFDQIFQPEEWKPFTARAGAYSMVALLLLGVICTGMDVSYKLSLPRVRCADPQDLNSVHLSCRNINGYNASSLLLNYRATNPSSSRTLCSAVILINGKEEPLNPTLPLEPNSSVDMVTFVPYPTSDTEVSFKATCNSQTNY